MPAHVRRFEIDWGWPRLSAPERAVVRRHEARARAEPGAHTVATLREALALASQELPGRAVRARVEDEHGVHELHAADGRCADADAGSFDEQGRFPELLTVDAFRDAGVESMWVGLYWPEDLLREMQAEAARLDRSVSWIVEKAWTIATSSTPIVRGRRPPHDGPRRKHSVYLSIALYDQLASAAAREDRSMSALAQRAIVTAWPTLTSLPADTG
jgi:uncharacterized small protein (TIGR04563 family)